MKKLAVLYFIILILIASCNTSTKPSNTVSMDDILSGDTTTHRIDTTTMEPTDTVAIDPEFLDFMKKMELPTENLKPMDTTFLVDRFANESSFKYNIDTKTFLAIWKFSSNAAAKNAFINWTQCYGKRCQQILLNDSTHSVSNEKMGMLVAANELVYWKGNHQKDFEAFAKKWLQINHWKTLSYAFFQDGKKKTKWYQLKDFTDGNR